MEYQEFSAKNVDDAITEACETLMVTSDRLDYEVVSNGSTGFLGIAAKPAVIKARIKEDKPEVQDTVEKAEPKKDKKPEKKADKKPAEKKAEPKEEKLKKAQDVYSNKNIRKDSLLAKANMVKEFNENNNN